MCVINMLMNIMILINIFKHIIYTKIIDLIFHIG